jgi:uncharacterized membrane protein HdeD (DUF308 family)
MQEPRPQLPEFLEDGRWAMWIMGLLLIACGVFLLVDSVF